MSRGDIYGTSYDEIPNLYCMTAEEIRDMAKEVLSSNPALSREFRGEIVHWIMCASSAGARHLLIVQEREAERRRKAWTEFSGLWQKSPALAKTRLNHMDLPKEDRDAMLTRIREFADTGYDGCRPEFDTVRGN